MTSALFLLRAVQMGLTITDLDNLEYGTVIDMMTESAPATKDPRRPSIATDIKPSSDRPAPPRMFRARSAENTGAHPITDSRPGAAQAISRHTAGMAIASRKNESIPSPNRIPIMKLNAQKKKVPARATPRDVRNSHVYAMGHVIDEMAKATPYAPQTTAIGIVSPARNLPMRGAVGILARLCWMMLPHTTDADAMDTMGSAMRMCDASTFADCTGPMMAATGRYSKGIAGTMRKKNRTAALPESVFIWSRNDVRIGRAFSSSGISCPDMCDGLHHPFG